MWFGYSNRNSCKRFWIPRGFIIPCIQNASRNIIVSRQVQQYHNFTLLHTTDLFPSFLMWCYILTLSALNWRRWGEKVEYALSKPKCKMKIIIPWKFFYIFRKNYVLKVSYILKWSLLWPTITTFWSFRKNFLYFTEKNPSTISNPKPKIQKLP